MRPDRGHRCLKGRNVGEMQGLNYSRDYAVRDRQEARVVRVRITVWGGVRIEDVQSLNARMWRKRAGQKTRWLWLGLG